MKATPFDQVLWEALAEDFAAAHPKAFDIPASEYERVKADYDRAAAHHGYRLAGLRLGRAVFTTKKGKTAA